MTSASDFNGPLYLEPVRGVRAFDVDALGRLSGVSFPTIWTPGENVAKCDSRRAHEETMNTLYARAGMARSTSRADKDLTPKPIQDTHMPNCSCGFWAFYNGENEYANSRRVTAVVEGYGTVVRGPKGFRAEKSRIVAIHLPSAGKSSGAWMRQVQRFWMMGKDDSDNGWLWVFFMFALTGMCLGIGGAISGFIVGSPWAASVSLAAAIACAWFGSAAIYSEGAIKYSRRDHRRAVAKSGPEASRLEVLAKVRRNYPDAAIFSTTRSMLRAFPPDKGVQPKEPTPEDDDFWSRPVSN